MRRAAVCAGVAAVALAGCGGGKSPRPTPPPAGLSIPWRLAAGLHSQVRVLHLLYTFPGRICDYRFGRAIARETAKAVTVGVYARFVPHPDLACIAVLGGGRTTVRLRAPLGRRRLLHAPVSRVPRQ
ncbi:MAG: hypothetical protein M3155_07205 [Actinomycetota bacterium]|nr:hypothetical protein [Actinomycetota bacterium]